MIDLLRQVCESGPVEGVFNVLLAFAAYLLLGLLPTIAALYLTYFLLTLPLRRNERARLFLDLLELGLNSGRTPEQAIEDAAGAGDSLVGSGFQLLAELIRRGVPLRQALDSARRFLPPPVRAMLRAGLTLGELRRVLPACRLSLHGGISEVRGALNYLLVLSFLATPFTFVIPILIKIKIIPAFQSVFAGMLEGAALPAFTRFILDSSSYLVAFQAVLAGLIWLLTLCYLGGPPLRAWCGRVLPGGADLVDRVLFWLPWRRKRLQRDFSAMLAVLLEAGLPEPEALRLAAECTANSVFMRRAERAGALLGQGVNLPEAVRVLDHSGELQWRLANALHSAGAFDKALTGWHEALDAKAFQLEQTAAQITTSAFVLLNGLIIGSLVIGLFLPLIQLLNRATLW